MCSYCCLRWFNLVKQVEMLIMSISGFKDCLLLRQQAQQSHTHSPLMPGLFLLRITLLFFNVTEEFGSGYLLGYMFFCHVARLFFSFAGSILHKPPEKAVSVRKNHINPKAEHFGNYAEASAGMPPPDLQSTEPLKISVLLTTLIEQAVFCILQMERNPMLIPYSFLKCGGCPGAMTQGISKSIRQRNKVKKEGDEQRDWASVHQVSCPHSSA